jgi:hypothetical protein
MKSMWLIWLLALGDQDGLLDPFRQRHESGAQVALGLAKSRYHTLDRSRARQVN